MPSFESQVTQAYEHTASIEGFGRGKGTDLPIVTKNGVVHERVVRYVKR